MSLTRVIRIQVHFIFRHQNPVTKEWEEKHLKSAPSPTIAENTNLYTLIVKYVSFHLARDVIIS